MRAVTLHDRTCELAELEEIVLELSKSDPVLVDVLLKYAQGLRIEACGRNLRKSKAAA